MFLSKQNAGVRCYCAVVLTSVFMMVGEIVHLYVYLLLLFIGKVHGSLAA